MVSPDRRSGRPKAIESRCRSFRAASLDAVYPGFRGAPRLYTLGCQVSLLRSDWGKTNTCAVISNVPS